MYIEVAVPVPSLPELTYYIDDQLNPVCGMRVVVSVGRQVVTGVVVAVNLASPENMKVKSVIKLIDETALLPIDLLKLGQWMAGYYRCTWGEALHAMLPGAVKPNIRQIYHLMEEQNLIKRRGTTAVILNRLQAGPLEKKKLLKDLPAAASRYLLTLEKEGVIRREIRLSKNRRQEEQPLESTLLEAPKTLSNYQQQALDSILAALEKKNFSGYLLHGVTGSGKTEVYLQAIARVLENNGGAILLVPEIALTSQIQIRIKARFGQKVAVLHSGLSPKERLEAWTRLLHGQATVALGARSAIFAPIKQLQLIVVDEEYESSYKQEDSPRYHARDVAAMRAKQARAVLIYGAATPCLESYYHAKQEKMKLLSLPQRIDQKKMPEIRLVDMSQEYGQAQRFPVFSSLLLDEISKRLDKKEQTILFLNRRGFAPLVMCPSCKHIVMCPDCSVSLVYHVTNDKLQCHSCGKAFPARPTCPKCGTACVKLVGSGTQRVEEELKRDFPHSRIVRLDQDMTRKKGVLEKTMAAFGNNEADILVGTQMVAKGIDFQNVTLVGIISADTALYLPDFRAEERTFQLIVQVAGRAGRGDRPGLVIAQTQHVDHDVLIIAADHDYEAFYNREIATRQLLGYPPFMRLVNIVCRSSNPSAAQGMAAKIADQGRRLAGKQDRVLGPAPSPYQRVAKESRYQVLIKAQTHQSRSRIISGIQGVAIPRDVKISIDVDPANLL